MKFQRIKEDIQNAPTVLLEDNGRAYQFQKFSFGEKGDLLKNELINEIIDGMVEACAYLKSEIDYIVSPEPGGHIWGLLLSYRLGIPLRILRIVNHGSGEKLIRRQTGYNENTLIIEGFQAGERVLLVDDVISTGGTIDSIAERFMDEGIVIKGVQVIAVKGECYTRLQDKLSVPFLYLEKVGVS